ncbi:hypothetical protein ACFVH4_17955 [Nocardia ignorata]|uniref:WXG100-like domain-containing protein n=2 Tax=Actinomycetes TaxID=1760 RepID=UPI0036370816
MALGFPSWLEPLEWLVGADWPHGNEDLMWQMGKDLQTAADDAQALVPELEAIVTTVNAAYPQGRGGESILQWIQPLIDGQGPDKNGSLAHLADHWTKLATAADSGGDQLQAAKLNFYIAGAWLLTELAWAAAAGPGAPLAHAIVISQARTLFRWMGKKLLTAIGHTVARNVTEEVLERIAVKLVYEIVQESLVELGQGTSQELAVQYIQNKTGHINGYDWKAVGLNAGISAIAGGVGGGVGFGLGRKLPTTNGKWEGARNGALTGAGAGLAGATAAYLATGAFTGQWDFDPRSFTGGAASGAGPSAIHGYRGNTDFAGPMTDTRGTPRAGTPSETNNSETNAASNNRAGDSQNNGNNNGANTGSDTEVGTTATDQNTGAADTTTQETEAAPSEHSPSTQQANQPAEQADPGAEAPTTQSTSDLSSGNTSVDTANTPAGTAIDAASTGVEAPSSTANESSPSPTTESTGQADPTTPQRSGTETDAAVPQSDTALESQPEVGDPATVVPTTPTSSPAVDTATSADQTTTSPAASAQAAPSTSTPVAATPVTAASATATTTTPTQASTPSQTQRTPSETTDSERRGPATENTAPTPRAGQPGPSVPPAIGSRAAVDSHSPATTAAVQAASTNVAAPTTNTTAETSRRQQTAQPLDTAADDTREMAKNYKANSRMPGGEIAFGELSPKAKQLANALATNESVPIRPGEVSISHLAELQKFADNEHAVIQNADGELRLFRGGRVRTVIPPSLASTYKFILHTHPEDRLPGPPSPEERRLRPDCVNSMHQDLRNKRTPHVEAVVSRDGQVRFFDNEGVFDLPPGHYPRGGPINDRGYVVPVAGLAPPTTTGPGRAISGDPDQEVHDDRQQRSTADTGSAPSVLAAAGLETGPTDRQADSDRAVLDGRDDRGSGGPRVLTDPGEVGPLQINGREITPLGVSSLSTADADRLTELGHSTPDLYELAPADADFFRQQMVLLTENNRFAASVHVYSTEEYGAMRLFVTDDGKAGIALKGDEIVSVFAHRDTRYPGASMAMLTIAIDQGGRRLDCFDTVLPRLYAEAGFVPVARLAWDDEYAPPGWDYDTFGKHNGGRPDVVFMAYDPAAVGSEYRPGAGRTVTDYDEGIDAARTHAPTDQTTHTDPPVDDDARAAEHRVDAELPVRHGPHSTTLGTDPTSRRVTENLRNEGAHDVVVHGNDIGRPIDDLGNPVDPQRVVEAVRANPDYVPGTPIRLVSCHSGNDAGWAQHIANELGVPVHAPTDVVGVRQRPDSPAVVQNDGHWRTFHPADADGNHRAPTALSVDSALADTSTHGDWDLMADESSAADPLTPADIESVYGIPIRNQRRIQGFIDRYNLIIQVRPTNPDSVPHLKAGAAPKPMAIKDKTINDLDVALGAPASAKGLVGRFGPGMLRMPDTTGMSDTRIKALEQRLRARAKDFDAYAADMAKLADRFVVTDGIVHQLIDGHEVPVTGDHDMFEILHADGTRLTPAELSLYEGRLAAIGAGIMHGPHVYWDPQSSFQRARNYESIIEQHQFDPAPNSKNEPLIEFKPGSQPTVTWASKTLREVDHEMTPWHVGTVIDGMEGARRASIPGLIDAHFGDSEVDAQDRERYTEQLRRQIETEADNLRQRAAELTADPDFDLAIFHAWADQNTKTPAPDGPDGQPMTAIRTEPDRPPVVVPTQSPEHELAVIKKQAAALHQLADRRDETFTRSDQLAAERGERTRAGVAHHTDDPARADLARQMPAVPGYFTADVRLSDDGHALIGDHAYTPTEYGDLLRAHGWDHSTPIRLMADNASINGFATHLAQHLRVGVLAPTAPIRIDADGNWNTHHPDGNVTPLPRDEHVGAQSPSTTAATAETSRVPTTSAPQNLPQPWPTDPVTGYVIQARDLEFLGLTEEQVRQWMAREAPLGMTPQLYQEWRDSFLQALRRDGVSVDQVDIRLRGSAADFFSGVHKQLPTLEELADQPEAQARLRDWLGDDPDRPLSRPFDSMHRLGVEEPSDFDINISSAQMFEQAAAAWDPEVYDGVLTKDHGYLNKSVVAHEYPHLRQWAAEWNARTGRDMSYAVFDATGPKDSSAQGFFVHFRDSDWIVQGPVPDSGRTTTQPSHQPLPPGPAEAIAPEAVAERAWSQDVSNKIMTADGTITRSETAKTNVIRSITDQMTAPLDRLLEAGRMPFVDPAMAEHLGDPDYVVALRNPEYPSMGGTLLPRSEIDPGNPAHAPDHLLFMDSPEAERTLREMAVSELVMSWAHTSNGTNVKSLAIQEAAITEFGLQDVQSWRMTPELRAEVEQEVARYGDIHRELLRIQYDQTQRWLAAEGVNNIVLYRGYSWAENEFPDWARGTSGTTMEMPSQRPLSSWTGERRIASDWLTEHELPGVIIASRFPREAVVAFPQTGIGCLWQVEFVALAGPGTTTLDVVHRPEATATVPAVDPDPIPADTGPTRAPATISTARYDFRQTVDEDGRRTTEVTVRAYLEQTPGVTAAQMQAVARTMIEASAQLFGDPAKAPPTALFPEKSGQNGPSAPRHALLNGDALRVDIEFVNDPDQAHLRAAVAPTTEGDGRRWAPDVAAETVIRAIGEHVGLTDATAGVESADIHRISHDLAEAIAATPPSPLAGVTFSHGTHSTTIGSDPATRRVTENLRNEGAHDVILHGDESGHPIDDNGAPLSPEQVADAILINPNYVPGTPVRLVSCFSGSAVGWAQQIADRLGVPVHAPTDIVGVRQRPNSPAVVHNDGTWLTFTPGSATPGQPETTPGERTSDRATTDGLDGWDFMADASSDPPPIEGLYAIPDTTIDARGSSPALPDPHVGPVPTGMVLGNDGLLHMPGDRADSYRTEDGRWHHHHDDPGTFRDKNFALHGGNRFIEDHLTSQDLVHKAQKEATEIYEVRDETVREALDQHSLERQAQQIERDAAGAVVKGHMAEFAIDRIHDLKAAELDAVIEAKREAVLADSRLSDAQIDAKLDRLDELRDNAEIYNRLGNEMVATSKAMGELGGNAYAVDSELRPNATLLSPFTGAFDGNKTIDTIAFVPGTATTPPTLIGTENKGLGSPLGDAVTAYGKSEQGSTEYGLHTLDIDQNLRRILHETHDEMRARGLDPESPAGKRVIEAREELTRALHDGTLRMEYHYVHARMDGTIEVARFIVDGGPNTSIAAIGGMVRDAEYPFRSRTELEQVLSRELDRAKDGLLRGLDSPDLFRAVTDAVSFTYGARDDSTIGKSAELATQLFDQQAEIGRAVQLGSAPDAVSRMIVAAQEQAARLLEMEIQSRIAVFKDVELGQYRDLVEQLIRLDVESRAIPLTTEIKYNERMMLRDAKALAIRFREHEDPARAKFIEHMLDLTREISAARGKGIDLELSELAKEYNALEQVIQVERAAEARAVESLGLDPRHAEQLAKMLDRDRANDFGRPMETLGREIVRQGTARAVEARELPALERGRVAELALTRVQEIERTLEQGREPDPQMVRETMDTLSGLVRDERAAESRSLEALGLSREHREEIGKNLELERAELFGRSMETLDKELVRQDHNRTVGDSKFRIGPELAKTFDVRAYRQVSDGMGRAVEDRALDAGDKSRQPAVPEFDSHERRLAIAAALLSKGVSLELTEVRMLVEMGQGVHPQVAIHARHEAGLRTLVRERERAREREARGMERGR